MNTKLLLVTLAALAFAAPVQADGASHGTAVVASSTTATTTPTTTVSGTNTSTASTTISTATPNATAATATPASSSQSEPSKTTNALVLDDTVRIKNWTYHAGTYRINFYSDRPASVSIVAPDGTDGQQGSVSSDAYVLAGGTTTTVTVSTTNTVTIWTEESAQQGRMYWLDGSSSLLTGPYTRADVQNAAIGGALGVVIAVLYEAVAAKVGAQQRGERVA